MNAPLALATAANIDRLTRENEALRAEVSALLHQKNWCEAGLEQVRNAATEIMANRDPSTNRRTAMAGVASTIRDIACAALAKAFDQPPSAALLHKECGNAVAALTEPPQCPKCGAAMTGQSMAGRRYCESCGHWPVEWSGSPGMGEQCGPTPDV